MTILVLSLLTLVLALGDNCAMCAWHAFIICVDWHTFFLYANEHGISALHLDPGLVTCKLRLGVSSCAKAATATNFLGTGVTHPLRMSDEGASVVPLMSLLFFQWR